VEKKLLALFKEISQRWLGLRKSDSEFRLNGTVFINPRTGKPLTKIEWKKIKESLQRAFKMVYHTEEETLVKVAMAQGKVLKGMTVEEAIKKKWGTIRLSYREAENLLSDPRYLSTLGFSELHTAEAIVELTDRSRKKIMDTILEGIKDRISPQELESNLFDEFGSLNRDWRRIAETEIGNSVNNGYLIAEMEKEKDPDAVIYMKGISAAGACPWCRAKVDNQVVVLLEWPPETGGDQIIVEGKQYTAIWPGKSNIGRKRANWWTAAGLQHPFCHCSWIRYEPGYEKYDKQLREALDKAAEAGRKATEERLRAERGSLT